MTHHQKLQFSFSQRGFTLVEIAIVLVIVGLLMGGLLMPLSTQVKMQKINETQKAMEEIKEAIVGFAMINGYLPCPDTDGDGMSNPLPSIPGAACAAFGIGNLPWVTLNVKGTDSWGNRYRYQVSPGFSATTTIPCANGDINIGLCDVGNIDVSTRNGTTKVPQVIADNVPAIIISYGPNGYGGTSGDGAAQATPPNTPPTVHADELTNATAGVVLSYISRPRTEQTKGISGACSDTAGASPFCEFDDVVTWITPGVLFNKMLAAGRLP